MCEQQNEENIGQPCLTIKFAGRCFHCGQKVENIAAKVQGNEFEFNGVCSNPACKRSLGGAGTWSLLQLFSAEDRVRILKDLGFVKDEDGSWFRPGEDPLD